MMSILYPVGAFIIVCLFLLTMCEVSPRTPKGLRAVATKIAVTRWLRQIILAVAVIVIFGIALGPVVSELF